jgi:pimeloyl-ACP methyl ester carboxylesterase
MPSMTNSFARSTPNNLAANKPGAGLIILPEVSHFAPWQDRAAFNTSVPGFIDR